MTEEDELPASCSPKKAVKDIPLLVIETVGNKAVKQDIVAKDDEMRDLVKSSLRKQGMLKQEVCIFSENNEFILYMTTCKDIGILM